MGRPDPTLGTGRRGLVREALQMIRFGLVGAAATGIHMAVAVGLAVGPGWPPLAANLAAFLVAFLFSFQGHFAWSFAGTGVRRRAAMVRFLVIALGAFAVNNGILAGLLEAQVVGPVPALVCAAVVIPIASYAGARLWAFRA
jgi:putative flippase GtrA